MEQQGEEMRVVTFLFADLVGSTALTQNLHPEEARLILGDAIARLIGVVETYGGYVKDLAGDGLLAFFGAPTAHEDDPERAIRAGLEMTEKIAAYADEVRRGWGIENFAVRVGVHAGEVVVGQVGGGGRTEFGAVGDAVNLAARIQNAAAPGTVLVTEASRRLTGDRFLWGEPLVLELKGVAHPVTAHTAISASQTGLHTPGLTPLVGREAELEVGREIVVALAGGQGGVLFLTGEPGIGKSRLASEIRADAEERGCAWLEGRCASYGEALPYWPYRDLLRGWLGLGTQEPEVRLKVTLRRRLEELFGSAASDLFPYLAGLLGMAGGERSEDVSPEALQFRTFEVFTEFVTKLASSRPLVVHLDDLHWADDASLALTGQLLPLVERVPLLLIVGMRPETGHGAWLLKEKSARDFRHLHREVHLAALTDESDTRLALALASRLGLSEVPGANIVGSAGGNPFYIEELVRSMADRSGVGGSEALLPPSLEGVILARIDRLEPTWREVLTSASTLGRSFAFDLLQATAEVDSGTLRQAVHHLLRLDLLVAERGGHGLAYRFKHALIQDAAYRTLVAPRRRLLHQRAAQWFEIFYAEGLERVYGLLAHHWERAEDRGQAAKYAELAGDQALKDWALDAAIEQYRKLLSLVAGTQREAETAELLFRLGTTLHLAMRFREANEVWAQAFPLWETRDRTVPEATATLTYGTLAVPWSVGRSAGSYATNQQLLQQLDDSFAAARPHPYIVPQLARSWSVNEDGTRYLIELTEASWSDGAPVLASDVVATYRNQLEPPATTNSSLLLNIEGARELTEGRGSVDELGVQALGERTVEMRLRRASPYFIFNFVYPEFSARREEAATGPFELKRMDEGGIVLERRPGYERRRGGNVKSVSWLKETPESLIERAAAGKLDAASAQMLNDRLMDPKLGLVAARSPQTATVFVAFSGAGHLEVDLHLRRALALAVDRASLRQFLAFHQVPAFGGMVPPDLPGHTPGIALARDLEAARDELARSGHRGPLMVVRANEQYAPYQQALIDGWRAELELEIEFEGRPLGTNSEWQGQFHVSLWNWVAHAPDPEYFLRNLLHGSSVGRAAGWRSEELDALLDGAAAAQTGSERLALFHEADRMVVRQGFAIPLVYFSTVTAHQPWVRGLWNWGASWLSWDEVTIDPH